MSLVQPLVILSKQYVIGGSLQGLQWPGGCQRFVSADPTLCNFRYRQTFPELKASAYCAAVMNRRTADVH